MSTVPFLWQFLILANTVDMKPFFLAIGILAHNHFSVGWLITIAIFEFKLVALCSPIYFVLLFCLIVAHVADSQLVVLATVYVHFLELALELLGGVVDNVVYLFGNGDFQFGFEFNLFFELDDGLVLLVELLLESWPWMIGVSM